MERTAVSLRASPLSCSSPCWPTWWGLQAFFYALLLFAIILIFQIWMKME